MQDLGISTPQMVTVGATGTNFDAQQAKNSVAASYMLDYLQTEQEEAESANAAHAAELQDYVHVFLNVPANTSRISAGEAVGPSGPFNLHCDDTVNGTPKSLEPTLGTK